MNDLSRLFVRRPRAIRITPFTPDRADHVMDNEGRKPIYFIETREGRRHIDETMLIAEKSDTYRHPMDPEVFRREYVNLLDYESAFVEELKSQIAEQLRKAVSGPDDTLRDRVTNIANALAVEHSQASIHQEHEEV